MRPFFAVAKAISGIIFLFIIGLESSMVQGSRLMFGLPDATNDFSLLARMGDTIVAQCMSKTIRLVIDGEGNVSIHGDPVFVYHVLKSGTASEVASFPEGVPQLKVAADDLLVIVFAYGRRSRDQSLAEALKSEERLLTVQIRANYATQHLFSPLYLTLSDCLHLNYEGYHLFKTETSFTFSSRIVSLSNLPNLVLPTLDSSSSSEEQEQSLDRDGNGSGTSIVNHIEEEEEEEEDEDEIEDEDELDPASLPTISFTLRRLINIVVRGNMISGTSNGIIIVYRPGRKLVIVTETLPKTRIILGDMVFLINNQCLNEETLRRFEDPMTDVTLLALLNELFQLRRADLSCRIITFVITNEIAVDMLATA